jgi:transposase
MNISTLLPDPNSLRLIYVKSKSKAILLVVKVTSTRAQCPCCNQDSGRIHSRYVCKLSDLPCQGVAVSLRLQARRFFCINNNCSQLIFCEQLPAVARKYARRTERLKKALSLIGFAIGGEVGARIAAQLGVDVSPDTLLRHIRQNVIDKFPTPRVLGVDDWAFRKGQSYGSILVDLERRCPVDLLPDRKAETVAAWLLNHPGIEVISRDRASAYSEGISKGAPQAVQVADRWHLIKNLSQSLKRLITRKHQFIHQAAQAVPPRPSSLRAKQMTSNQPTARIASTRAQREKAQRREKRLALYAQSMQLLSCGMSMRMIAKTTGISSRTLRRWVRADGFPERAKSKRNSIVGRFVLYLRRRWEEGCHNTRQLWRELCAQGFDGSSEIVRYHLADWRRESSVELRHRHEVGRQPNTKTISMTPPTPRQAVWMLLKYKEDLNAD